MTESKNNQLVSIYSQIRNLAANLADRQIRLGDAVLVGSLLSLIVVGFAVSRGNVYISFDSRQKHLS